MSLNRKFEAICKNAGNKLCQIGKPATKAIYISSDGCEENDGLSEACPKYDIRRVPEYLKAGYSVLIKAGSEWYIPDFTWRLTDIYGTQNAPLLVGTYGDGAAPVIADMRKIETSDLKSDGEYLTLCGINDILRLYIDGRMLVETDDLKLVDTDTFFQRNAVAYISNKLKPRLIEILALDDWGRQNFPIYFKNVSYLTLQNIDFRGSQWTMIKGEAPSDHVAFDHCEFSRTYRYASQIGGSEDDLKAIHNAISFTDCVFNKIWTKKAEHCFRADKYVTVRTSDAISLVNAFRGAYIGGNIVRDYGHTGIDLQVHDPRYTGIHDCIIERNTVSGTNSGYLRACETIGPEGLCTNNTVRYNYFYDLTNSSHLMGENNKYYCNVFAFIVPTEIINNVQPYAMDSMTWKSDKGFEFIARGNLIANNTVYNCHAALAFKSNAYTSTVVNNIFAGWSYPGAVRIEETREEIELLNNCFFSVANDNVIYKNGDKENIKLDGLNAMKKSSDNIWADPEFTDAENCDFTLKEGSLCAVSGRPISSFFDKPYFDMDGNPFDPEHPSVGAFSIKI